MNKKRAESKEKRSFRKELSLIVKGYKLLFKMSKANMILRAVNAVWPQITPYITLYMSSEMLNELASGADISRLLTLALITVVSALAISMIGRWIDHWAWLYEHIMWDNNRLEFNRVQNKMKYQHLEDPEVAKLKSEILHMMNYGGNGLMQLYWTWYSLFNALFNLIASVALTVSMFSMYAEGDHGAFLNFINSPWSALIVIILIVTNVAVSMVTSNRQTRKQRRIWNEVTHEYRRAEALRRYFMNPEISLAQAGKYLMTISKKFFLTREKQNYYERQQNIGFRYGAVRTVWSTVMNIALYIYVGAKAFIGAFGIGSFVLYRGTVEKFIGAISTLGTRIGLLKENNKYLEELYKYLDLQDELNEGKLVPKAESNGGYSVEFKNVSFKYPGTDKYALKNVNFKFNIGEKLAFVGMNGSGKTTFVKLLCRLYEPTDGKILLNSVDVREYDFNEYIKLFSVVFQDFTAFQYELAYNVSCEITPDRDRVVDCLERAGLGNKLAELEKGVDTCVGKRYDLTGVDFSGGEKQKIAIARALYKESPFIILDEPTASLDPLAEADIYARFNEIVTDKTAVYISHRLSSCRFCDKIVVFDEGGIIQQGSHDELVNAAGKYCELWHAQAQYYTE